ncbi:MAG: thioredoxin family protein [Bacteroidales bacterium]|nr:thioredoxin family protein [Bacteroidales bacterium]
MTNEITSLEAIQEMIRNEKGVAVYFYNDRCAPCVSLRPKVQQLIDEDFPEMKLVFVNSETNPAFPAHFGVFANPCILIFFEGKEFNRYSKYISINQLGGDISRIYEIVF